MKPCESNDGRGPSFACPQWVSKFGDGAGTGIASGSDSGRTPSQFAHSKSSALCGDRHLREYCEGLSAPCLNVVEFPVDECDDSCVNALCAPSSRKYATISI